MGELVARVEFEDDVTAKEADRHTRDLVLALERLDVDDVRMGEGEGGTGTRGDLTAVAGLVLVSGIAIRHALTPLVTVIGAWLERTGQKSVTIEKDGAKVTVSGPVAAEDVRTYVRALDGPAADAAGDVAGPAGTHGPTEGEGRR